MRMNTNRYRFDGDKAYRPEDIGTADKSLLKDKAEGRQRLERNRAEIADLQNTLYAEGTQSLLIIFQAMDAAGKDGTIRHVFTGVNPQGVSVSSFKQPSSTDMAHDYLWRIHAQTPARGMIGIFNRSHYEDVLVGRVLDLPKTQALPAYARKDIWEKRYRQIRDFERMLHENGTTVIKFYLHLSQKEQHERFLARADDPAKRWKFSTGDLETSARWDDYMKAYEHAINETAKPHAPWYVIPADRKWYARAVVSEIVLGTLRDMNPTMPVPTEAQLRDMEAYRAGQQD